MPYRSSDKTRQKKDAKRTAMMQAAVQTFAEKGYHAATVRDIVNQADVAIGTFYFYFPDKETLFLHLYEETADFLLQAIRQGVNSRTTFSQQVKAGVQAYVNLAVYEPAIIQLLLVGGIGALPSLSEQHLAFRREMHRLWQRPLDQAAAKGLLLSQNTRRTAEAIVGALDEVILSLLNHPQPDTEAPPTIRELTAFVLRAAAYTGE